MIQVSKHASVMKERREAYIQPFELRAFTGTVIPFRFLRFTTWAKSNILPLPDQLSIRE